MFATLFRGTAATACMTNKKMQESDYNRFQYKKIQYFFKALQRKILKIRSTWIFTE